MANWLSNIFSANFSYTDLLHLDIFKGTWVIGYLDDNYIYVRL